MNAPYFRTYFNRFISIHAKTVKESNKAFYVLEEVENAINRLYKRGGKQSVKEAGNFVKHVIVNNELKVEVVFDGAYLIDNTAN